MISSEDTVDAVRRAFDLGASDYISRPFDAKVVYQRIINTIQLYAKQRRLSAMAADLALKGTRQPDDDRHPEPGCGKAQR